MFYIISILLSSIGYVRDEVELFYIVISINRERQPVKCDYRPYFVLCLKEQTPNTCNNTIPIKTPFSPAVWELTKDALKVILLPLLPLRLTLGHNPLAQPLSLKAFVQFGQILDNQFTSSHNSFLGCDGAIGLDAEFKGSEEWVRDFVRGEHDGGVLEETLREEVAEGVVFFVEGEDGGVRDAWCALVL